MAELHPSFVNFFRQPETQGLIFDCDGLLVDSEPMSCYALNVLFKKHFDVDIGTNYNEVLGKTAKDSILYYFDKFNISHNNIEKLALEKDEIYKRLANKNLKSFTGVLEFIQLAFKWNYKLAVASSGSLNKIHFSLTTTNLGQLFPVIVSSSQVANGKPAPDIFLKAAEELQLDPKRCIVFEDSWFGILAAKNAGMKVVGITNTISSEELEKAGADIIVKSFLDFIQTTS